MNQNYGWGLPVQASSYAGKLDGALFLLHGVMLLIFVLWAFYMIFCLIRYRQKNSSRALYSHKTPWSSYIPDALMLIFEIWLIFVVGIPIWAHIREDLPKEESSSVIHIVAEQFAWTIHYPGLDGKFGKQNPSLINADNPLGLDENDPDSLDDIVSVNELYLPLGKPVRIMLSSKDVIHSFFVPEFRIKQDVVPGMNIPIWFEPTKLGIFEIGCAQLCGTGHYRMRGDVFVKSEEEFNAWINSRIKKK